MIGGINMMTNTTDNQVNTHKELSPNTYFEKSLDAFNNSNKNDAIYFIDLAISSCSKKEFFMFQKAKMFFALKSYSECSNYIEENILFFYKNCSLYIFSQIINYYQLCTTYSPASLSLILRSKNIPYALACEYYHIINKNNVDFINKAVIAKKNNKYELCISYCDLVLNYNNSEASTYLLKSQCHHLLGQTDLAISAYTKLLELTPFNDSIYHTLGIVMMELNRYPEAISFFEQATKLLPSNTEYRFCLGDAFFKWRKYDSALKCFKDVITKEPTHINSYIRIAEIYIQINNNKKARKYYKQANLVQKKYLQSSSHRL